MYISFVIDEILFNNLFHPAHADACFSCQANVLTASRAAFTSSKTRSVGDGWRHVLDTPCFRALESNANNSTVTNDNTD